MREIIVRKAILVVILLCVLASLAGGVRLYAAATAVEQAALWSELKDAKNKPSASKLESWNVIEGIPLIKKTDNVSKKAAALATVIKHDNGERFIIGDDQVAAVLAKIAEKKGLKERDLAKLRERFGKHNSMLSEEYENAKKGRGKFLTRGVDFSRLIEKYIDASHGDVVKAVNAFASKRAYTAEIITKENPPFSYIADSVTMGKPLILQQAGTDNFLVCVGFLSKAGKQYIITADPGKIDFEEVSNADLIHGKGEMATKLREAAKGFDKKFGLAKLDRKFQLAGEMPQGVEIINWSQGAYASFVFGFAVTDQSVDKTFFPLPLFPWLTEIKELLN